MTTNVSPANLGITPTTTPETLEALDKNGNWVPIGTMDGGVFTPVGGGGGGGIPEAPTGGVQYGRQSASWTPTLPDAPSGGLQYGRQSGAWTPSVPEAPPGGGQYGRQSGGWTLITGSGGAVLNLFDTLTQFQATNIPATVQSAACTGYAAAGDLLGNLMTFKRVATHPGAATFTGSIAIVSGVPTLTFPSATGTPAIGQVVTGAGVIPFVILSGSGLSWVVNIPQVVASVAMTASTPLAYVRSADRFLPNGTTDATNGGYWVLANNIVMPEMFGAKRDGATNDSDAIQAVINWMESVPAAIPGLSPYVAPIACAFTPGTYQLTRGLVSTRAGKYLVPSASVLGASASGAAVVFRFPAAFAGPYGWHFTYTGSSDTCTVENINLLYNTGALPPPLGGGPTPAPIHGWFVESGIRMTGCGAFGWPGNGWHINGASDGSGFAGAKGFVDGSRFVQCVAFNNGYNGFYGYGQDFNICTFDQCSAGQNGQFGFRDQGFLGNVYINCHTTANGFLGPAVATQGGASYQVIPGTSLNNSDFALTLPSICVPNTPTSAFSGTFAGATLTTTSGAPALGHTLTGSLSSTFVGGISLFNLTITSGTPVIGQTVTGPGVSANTHITGGSGLNWTVDVSQTVTAGTTLTGTQNILPNTHIIAGGPTVWTVDVNQGTLTGPMTITGTNLVWVQINKGIYGSYLPWVSGTLYQSGGPYAAGGTAMHLNCYSEGGQPYSWIRGTALGNGTLGSIVPYIQAASLLFDGGFQQRLPNVAGGFEDLIVYNGNSQVGARASGTTVFWSVQGTVSGTWQMAIDKTTGILSCNTPTQNNGWGITSQAAGAIAGAPKFGLATAPAGQFTIPFLGLGHNVTNPAYGILISSLPNQPASPAPYGAGWFTFASGAAVTGNGLLGWQCTIAGSPGTQTGIYGHLGAVTLPIGTAAGSLPAASVGAGARACVTNASQTASGNFGAALSATTGANKVPVYSDGAGWFIG